MTKIKAILKRISLALCVGVALALNACSPGTGGTGTGPSQLISPVAFSSFPISTSNTTLGQAPQPGVSDSTVCNQAIRLQLQADRIELSTPCGTLTYVGSWSVSTTGGGSTIEVYGAWKSNASPNGQAVIDSQDATLLVSFLGSLDASVLVTASVKDSAGRLLLDPTVLQRAPL